VVREDGGGLEGVYLAKGLITVFPLSCSVNGSKMITGGIIFEIPNVSCNEKKKKSIFRKDEEGNKT